MLPRNPWLGAADAFQSADAARVHQAARRGGGYQSCDPGRLNLWRFQQMNDSTREKLLKIALVAFGAIFFLIYPLGLIWPSGWLWHAGEGKYYLQMICGVYAVLGAFLIAAA